MKIQKLKLNELKPLEQNVRKHSEKQINELIRSVQQFGQTRAIVIDEENNILIGNGLHEAMLKAGMQEAFIYRKRGLTQIEKKKLILADNKTYSLGADDFENIESYLEEITSTGDFDVAGFDEDVLRNLMREADEVLQDVQSYGVLTPEVVDKKREAGERVEHGGTQEKPVESPVSASDAVQEADQEEVATILCPNCGECIPID